MGRRPRAGIGAQHAVVQDLEAVDRHRFDAEIERTGLPSCGHAGFDQTQKLLEDRI
jgi:hypothetical protein